MCLFQQSTRVDWLVVEISRDDGLRTDSPAGDVWIRTMSFVVGAHRPTSPFILATFTNGYQGQEIDRIFLYRIPAEGIPEDGIAGGEILPSRVPVDGTKDAGLGL